MKKEIKDIRMINVFCMELYDILYYYIMFDKIKVMKKMLRIFELLAVPISCIGANQRVELFKKFTKIKL